jgi:hypothetical protein
MSSYYETQPSPKSMMQQAEDMPSSVYYFAVLGSIVASALLFMSGRRNLGIFVGLWPLTILNLALFNKQLRPSQDVDRAMSQMDRAA